MNPANLKRYAMKNIKLKEEGEAMHDAIYEITNALESYDVAQELIEAYINDIFTYASYDLYKDLSSEEIYMDFTEWESR